MNRVASSVRTELASIIDRLSRKLSGNALFWRFVRNASHLAGGNAAAVAIGMITLGVTARMLGPAMLGILATIEGYGKMVDQLIRLETWQSTIRYGADAIDRADRDRFMRLIKFGVVVDAGGASLAAMTAFICVPLAAAWLGWGEETRTMARVYCISVLFGISSTPIGVLRLFNMFARVAWLDPAFAVARLIGITLFWALGYGLWSILILGIALQCGQRVLLGVMAWRALRERGYGGMLSTPLAGTTRLFPGIWGFIGASNGSVLVRKSVQELDILIVAGLVGPVGAGLYQVVRKFTLAATKAGAMLQQAILPDLAKLWSRGEVAAFLRAIRQVEMMTTVIGLAFVAIAAVAGDQIIRLVAGPRFVEAALPLVVQSLGSLLFLSGSALRPGMMMMGRQGTMFGIVCLSALGFFATIFVTVPILGVVGASCAYIVFNAIWLPASLIQFRSALRQSVGSSSERSVDNNR